MSHNSLDMSGTWDGVFTYPQNALPTTPFLAQILERAGMFSGQTQEPDLYSSKAAKAVLIGHRAGRAVDFTKTYDHHDKGYSSPVDYVGQLSDDGGTVTGSWTMQEWSGTFEMIRQSTIEVGDQREEPAEVG